LVTEIPVQNQNQQQWLILLLTVCIQIIVLFGSGIYILTEPRTTAAKTDHSQVVIKNSPDLYQPLPAITNVPSSETAKSEPIKSESAKSELIKPESAKPEPAITNLVKETISPITVSSQNPNSDIVSDTKTKPEKSKIPSPVPSVFSSTSLVTETAAKTRTVQNEKGKTETVQSNQPNQSEQSEQLKVSKATSSVTTSAKPLETATVTLKKENATNKALPEAIRIAAAESLFEESAALLNSEPERSLKDILSAVKTFEELGRSIPSAAYWALGQAYASLSWGKMFLLNSPSVENVTVSSDSRWMLTQRQDNSVWIWDLFRDQNSRNGIQLDSGRIPYVKLAFSPDLRLIIGGRTDGTILIWDMARPNPAETPVSLKEKVIGLRDLQISPDGCWLAAFGGQARSSAEIVRNNRYVDSIESVESFVPIETDFVANENYFRNIKEPFPSYRIVRLRSIMPLPDNFSGNSIISNTIPLEFVGNAAFQEQPISSHKNIQVTFLSEYSTASPEKPLPETRVGSEIVTTLSEPNSVWLWDLRQVHNGFIPPPIVLRGHKQEIRLIQFSADSGKLAVGGEDSTTLIYDIRERKIDRVPFVLRGHRLDITAITFAPNGSWVATGSRDNTIRLWNLTDSKGTPDSVVLNGHLGWISSLIVDQSGTRLFSGSYDKTIRIWRLDRNDIKTATEREPLILQSHQGVVRELALSPDGKKLVSLGGDGSLRMRNIDGVIDERHSVTLRNRMLPISKIALTPDNRWLIFSYTNQKNPANSGIRLWPLDLDHLMQLISE
jgi:WD40 repeat protein